MAGTGKTGKKSGGGGGIVGTILMVAAIFSCTHAFAQDQAQTPESAPQPAPLTRDCATGGKEVSTDSPLPVVATALEKRKTLTILSIGASTRPGRKGRGAYSEEIERMLRHAMKGLNVVMINRGVSGELAANAATRIRNEVALNDPDLVLWQVGSNDALAYLPVEDVAAVVVETVRWLREHKVDVILVGLQAVDRSRRNDQFIAMREALRKVAADENVIIIRRDEAMQMIKQAEGDKDNSPFIDAVDQNEQSYLCLAEYAGRAIAIGAFAKGLRRNTQGAPQSPSESSVTPAPVPLPGVPASDAHKTPGQ
jgi:acyl-CoA thioesterase-1